ncbi:MAG: MAPEG family protein [Deltaproteobacteria bacterium]|nr:MAPEG family protein [Deltaproteobacteria bacterium]
MLVHTSITLLILIPLFLFLTFRIIRYRRVNKVSIGDRGDIILLRRIRMHANFTEYTPIAIILLALCEFNQAPFWRLCIGASLLVIGRYLHCWGLWSATSPGSMRVLGMFCTLFSIISLSITLLLSIA